MPTKQKIMLAIVIFLTALGFGFILYYLFFRPTPPPVLPPVARPEVPGARPGLPGPSPLPPTVITPEPTAPTPPAVTPTVPPIIAPVTAVTTETARGGLTRVTTLDNSLNTFTALNGDGRTINTYDRLNEKFYRLDAQGNKTELSDKRFPGVESASWSPVKNQAILEFPDGSNVYYDFETETQVTLPQHWQEFNFSAGGNQLAFKSYGIDRENRWLAVSSPDGANAEILEALGENGDRVQVDWAPNNQVVAFFTESTGFDRQNLFFVGLNGENFQKLAVPGMNFTGLWSTGGDKILFSATNQADDFKPRLWVVDWGGEATGDNRLDLGLETWADKCTFANNTTVYCAVPTRVDTGVGLSRQIHDDRAIPDYLYKLNLQTGSRELIAKPANNVTVDSLMVSADQKFLFFTDNLLGNIQKINLP